METKWTHGPWEIGEDCGSGQPVITAEARDICTVESYFGDGSANARLIAAAPELADVCMAVARLNEGQGRMNLCEIAGMARAALKAAGVEV